MNDAIQKAIEEADEACPCFDEDSVSLFHNRDAIRCKCWVNYAKTRRLAYRPTGENLIQCDWKGHAAIRKVAKVCVEEAAKTAEPVDDVLASVT